MKTISRQSLSVSLAIVIAVAGVPLLTGCSAEGAVNGAVQGATGGDVSLGGKLPTGWPDEVAVIDGELLFGARGAGDNKDGWVVTVKSDATDPLEEARKTLEDAGFVGDTRVSAGDASVVAMKNDTYTVVVASNSDGLLYTVSPG
ncbi:hypothetical protein E3T54_04155 [Cryobacterium sp. Sr8]|uniref:Uncharacterized protein n=1 Tax=Cryobacterium psychrotolerans TaxID=386301 RepID=A0A1G8XPX6_9MICO|nr:MULTISPECIES: hypothetical protein [Cryobacterium]TFD44917.1 hypothetical protein E3T33_07630 [Cryobacterium sp. TMT1-2-1]TFD80125.1 hypothetical protein E3T54_04155 [Cryobacterium sp. Sr8]TFD82837.1 hypothetical protein E3T56_13850 [Cryobacterium psychrotolerans]SDJ92496.1 hypothetical protein SAMN05216282_101311 [Cryobacterium psychrotolerans]